jgi:hypothetical protein
MAKLLYIRCSLNHLNVAVPYSGLSHLDQTFAYKLSPAHTALGLLFSSRWRRS